MACVICALFRVLMAEDRFLCSPLLRFALKTLFEVFKYLISCSYARHLFKNKKIAEKAIFSKVSSPIDRMTYSFVIVFKATLHFSFESLPARGRSGD